MVVNARSSNTARRHFQGYTPHKTIININININTGANTLKFIFALKIIILCLPPSSHHHHHHHHHHHRGLRPLKPRFNPTLQDSILAKSFLSSNATQAPSRSRRSCLIRSISSPADPVPDPSSLAINPSLPSSNTVPIFSQSGDTTGLEKALHAALLAAPPPRKSTKKAWQGFEQEVHPTARTGPLSLLPLA